MHRLEPPCKDSQKSLDKGAGLSGAVRMAPSACGASAGPSWAMPGPSRAWASSSLAQQPGTSWSASGLGPPSATWTTATTQPNISNTGGTGAGASTSIVMSAPSPGTSAEPLRKPRVFNIHQKLKELYLEECRNVRLNANLPVPLRNLKRGSRLLEKLVDRENLNTLIVNLYPGNKGYSLSLRVQGKVPAALGNQAGRSQGSEAVVETTRWPYSDEELLRCIDREELPPTLVDILETDHSKLFYQGCVIAEIRDFRLTFPSPTFETHHVLLKPTTQSILNDVNLLSAAHDLSPDERLSLESHIVQATAPPLCLDPNPAVGTLLNNMQAKKHRFSTAPLRRMSRKFSQVTVNRKRKLDQFTAHNELQLFDFITRKRAKQNQGKQTKKNAEGVLPQPPPVPRDEPLLLAAPTTPPDVFKFAKHYEKPNQTIDCSATLVEEYILETERTPGIIYHIKLTILQRGSNAEYLGELYVDKDYKEGERNGSSCRFVLGTRAHANRYIQQFTEIFTEEGRKSVRITHIVPGQPGRVSFTQGMRERSGAIQAAAAAQRPLPINAQQVVANVATATQPPSCGIAKVPATNVQSVSHLTNLLKNATGPPNVNVQQIQQQAAGLSNSAIQSILSGALSSGVIPNGPTPGPSQTAPNNSTVHYQPAAAAANTVTKPSRPPLSSHPRVTALATSLENFAEQYQMQVANQANQAQAAAQPAATPASAQNPTIVSLLNAGTPIANQKLVARKANVNIQNTRLINQNINNVNNSAVLLNRVTLSSFPNTLVGQAGQSTQTASATGAAPAGFALVTTQASPQQTYSITTLAQPQAQAYTLTPNTASQGFTLSPAHNSQTFTVLQPNQNFSLQPSVQSQTFQINPAGTTGQTYTISTPVVTQQPNQVITVNVPQTNQPVGKAKAFTIQTNNQSFKTTSPRPAAQRRPSNAFQQVVQSSDTNKLINDRSDSRLLTERHIAEKPDASRLNQVLTEGKVATETSTNIGLSMPGLRGLLAGTPSADNPMAGASSSPLLDRLTTPTAPFTSPPPAFPPPSPAPSPSQNITFQSGGPFGSSPSHGFGSATGNSPLPNLTSPTLAGFGSPSPKAQVQFQGASPATSPLSSPPGSTTPVSLNLQGLSLQGLTSLPSGLQVSIPGIAVPISLSLSVTGQPGTQGVLMTSLPVAATTNTTTTTAATMVLSNSATGGGSLLSLPVAQLMGTSSKGAAGRSPGTASISIPQSSAQSIQLVSALQRSNNRSSGTQVQVQSAKTIPNIAVRGQVTDQRQATVKMAAGAAAGAQILGNSAGSQMVALSPQQFQLLQKHGFQSLNLSAGCLTPQKNAISAASIANKHRRRSSAADPNK